MNPLKDFSSADPCRDLYLDLMKRCLINSIYGGDKDMRKGTYARNKKTGQFTLLDAAPADPKMKYEGRIWPSIAHTMIGMHRLDNLQSCVEDVLARNVPGDLLEAGVWRGGASIFMRAILKAHGVDDRCVWVADSFEGLPEPDVAKYPADAGQKLYQCAELAVSLDEVKSNFDRYGLLDEQVHFLKGWFRDSLPRAPVEQLAVLRLDGDMYESTMDGLVHLYPKLAAGGYVVVDDLGAVKGCGKAVRDFREQNGISDEIMPIDGIGAYWQKTQVHS